MEESKKKYGKGTGILLFRLQDFKQHGWDVGKYCEKKHIKIFFPLNMVTNFLSIRSVTDFVY